MNYPIAAEIYLGTQPTEARNICVAKDLVLRLTKNYLNMGINITMDNFFTSYQLARELAAKNTTLVGTIRLNKRELPKEFSSVEQAKKRAINSSVFCFSNECELVSYVTRKKKMFVCYRPLTQRKNSTRKQANRLSFMITICIKAVSIHLTKCYVATRPKERTTAGQCRFFAI